MLDSLKRRPRGGSAPGVLLHGVSARVRCPGGARARPARSCCAPLRCRGLPLAASAAIHRRPGRSAPLRRTSLPSRSLGDEHRALYESMTTLDPLTQRRLLLAFARVTRVRTRWSRSSGCHARPRPRRRGPPRGPLRRGATTTQPTVAEALRAVGGRWSRRPRGLRLRCRRGATESASSPPAFPETAWSGCDPIPGAIAWAQEYSRWVTFAPWDSRSSFARLL